MPTQSTDTAAQTRARADRLLGAVVDVLPPGPHADAARDAAVAVTRAAGAPTRVALLAEGGDDRVVSHRLWQPLLGDGAPAVTPERSTIGYVTAVRLRAVDAGRAALRTVSVSFLDRAEIARCRADLVTRWGGAPPTTEPTADWADALADARRRWPGADPVTRAGLTELVALYRAEVFAEYLLGAEEVPARLGAVHQATMPFQRARAGGGVPAFPDPVAPGPYAPGTALTEGVLHRILPVVRRVTVEVEVPQSHWPLADEPVELVDLPVLDPRVRTGRAVRLSDGELAAATAVVLLPGPRREAERAVQAFPELTVLTGPPSATLLAGRLALDRVDELRAAVLGVGRQAGRAARAARAHAAHLGLRRVLRDTVAALDREPAVAPPPPAAEGRLRDLVGRVGAELSALIDDVARGVAGPDARLAGDASPQEALTRRVVVRVHSWPQWAMLLAALDEQVLQPGAGFDREELPVRPDAFEARFRATLREVPAMVAEVVDATVGAWQQRWSTRLTPLRTALLDDVEPARERLAREGADAVLGRLRRAVQPEWLTRVGPPAAVAPLDAEAARAAFPLAPDRLLPWHDPHGHGRHQMTVMRLRRELVEAVRRLAIEGLAVEQVRRVDALRRELRELRDALPRTDAEIRVLTGVERLPDPDPPQLLARRIEALLDDDDHWPRADEEGR
ncbi:hypothetical protein [Micromonospora sp. DT233]|uniref:hypothetical protein n=1 Tax=Micromonospora sp. DT233 TaxID=3393432 RepID=UPI003CE689E5